MEITLLDVPHILHCLTVVKLRDIDDSMLDVPHILHCLTVHLL